MLPPFIKDHIYDDSMSPTSPPPLLALFIQAHPTYVPVPNQVERTSQPLPYIAKLKSVQKQDSSIVLYDTYYGQKLLFDELHQVVHE